MIIFHWHIFHQLFQKKNQQQPLHIYFKSGNTIETKYFLHLVTSLLKKKI